MQMTEHEHIYIFLFFFLQQLKCWRNFEYHRKHRHPTRHGYIIHQRMAAIQNESKRSVGETRRKR